MPLNIPLKNLLVLAVDCQTTGGKAENNHLLEIGWLTLRAGDLDETQSLNPTTFLVKPPDGQALMPHVKKLTGIDEIQLEKAIDAADAGRALFERAAAAAAHLGVRCCPAVIHFARFEMPLLRSLHQLVNMSQPFPLDVICTHQISLRLFPGLPRKGLRAMAGYFGHTVPGLRRCDPHIRATAIVWRHLVERLAEDANIVTLDQLRCWLLNTQVPTASKRTYPMPREMRRGMPNGPGVYRMKSANGDLLYVGKARSLKQRVNSYFQASRRHSENTLEMLTQAVRLDVTITPTALEAALLESDEIKQFNPAYNIALKAGKGKLAFVSTDFGHQASKRDELCRLGPIPSRERFAAVHVLGKQLSGDVSPLAGIHGARLLAVPERYSPDEESLRLGMNIFQEKYRHILNRGPIWRALIRIGRLSWTQKLDERKKVSGIEDSLESPEDDGDKTLSEFSWTPEAVVKTLESLLRYCGALLRRASWLTIISESTVAWEARSPKPTCMNVLILHNGKIIQRSQLEAGAFLPVPPGSRLAFKDRQSNLDLGTYDRLRVLTTEFRRLLSEKRRICIRLSPTACLNEDQLYRLMRWI